MNIDAAQLIKIGQLARKICRVIWAQLTVAGKESDLLLFAHRAFAEDTRYLVFQQLNRLVDGFFSACSELAFEQVERVLLALVVEHGPGDYDLLRKLIIFRYLHIGGIKPLAAQLLYDLVHLLLALDRK